MDNAEIMRRLEEYCKEIYRVPLEDAKALEREIDSFCEENHVTQEQIDKTLVESGAGEILGMLVTIPEE